MEPGDFWIWAAGTAVASWTVLLTFILGAGWSRMSDMDEKIKGVSREREDKCIPRLECERTHATVDNSLIEIKKMIKSLDDKITNTFFQRGKD